MVIISSIPLRRSTGENRWSHHPTNIVSSSRNLFFCGGAKSPQTHIVWNEALFGRHTPDNIDDHIAVSHLLQYRICSTLLDSRNAICYTHKSACLWSNTVAAEFVGHELWSCLPPPPLVLLGKFPIVRHDMPLTPTEFWLRPKSVGTEFLLILQKWISQ